MIVGSVEGLIHLRNAEKKQDVLIVLQLVVKSLCEINSSIPRCGGPVAKS